MNSQVTTGRSRLATSSTVTGPRPLKPHKAALGFTSTHFYVVTIACSDHDTIGPT